MGKGIKKPYVRTYVKKPYKCKTNVYISTYIQREDLINEHDRSSFPPLSLNGGFVENKIKLYVRPVKTPVDLPDL